MAVGPACRRCGNRASLGPGTSGISDMFEFFTLYRPPISFRYFLSPFRSSIHFRSLPLFLSFSYFLSFSLSLILSFSRFPSCPFPFTLFLSLFLSLLFVLSLTFSRSHVHFHWTFTLSLNRHLTSRFRLRNYTTFTLRSPSPLSLTTLFTLRSPRERKAILDATADPRNDRSCDLTFRFRGSSMIRGSR